MIAIKEMAELGVKKTTFKIAQHEPRIVFELGKKFGNFMDLLENIDIIKQEAVYI
ncbi:hypothetical protein [Peribacillus simplex]|uniref:hypothetical protein n=1 Tax=Peribacillus simplex TaxID=1478 RepID=UPI0016283A4F|nr:hypothetical protein [Peribacillus simplex]